uniref:GATOR complex protein NPRL3 n=1 Tax=Parastrongyloides trichosuri TaxID=131310 RepID=A0A0N4ZN53_PARTI
MEILHKDKESDKPLAVILAARWSTECHVLFIHSLCVDRFFRLTEELNVEPDSLAEYLLPSKSNRQSPYEAKAESVLFVGYPYLISNSNICIGITWVLDGDVDKNFIHSYQQLSSRLSQAVIIEENRKIMLQKEIDDMISATPKYNEEWHKNNFQIYFNESILKMSNLAQTLKDVYHQIWDTGLVHTFINNNVELGFILAQSIPEFTLNVPNIISKDISEVMKKIRPYHTVVLMKDIIPSPDSSPLYDQLVKHFSPEKSFSNVSVETGISIGQIFLTIRNLLTWVPCSIIYPICMSNVYTSALHLNHSESLLKDITRQFKGANILKIIAFFSPPCTLKDFLSNCPNENSGNYDLKNLFICLLKYRFVIQVHNYFTITMPFSDKKPSPPQDTEFYKTLLTYVTEKNPLPKEYIPYIMDIVLKLKEEQNYNTKTIIETLELFFNICKILEETEHLEGIIFRSGMQRGMVLKILDVFKDIISSYYTTNLIP